MICQECTTTSMSISQLVRAQDGRIQGKNIEGYPWSSLKVWDVPQQGQGSRALSGVEGQSPPPGYFDNCGSVRHVFMLWSGFWRRPDIFQFALARSLSSCTCKCHFSTYSLFHTLGNWKLNMYIQKKVCFEPACAWFCWMITFGLKITSFWDSLRVNK